MLRNRLDRVGEMMSRGEQPSGVAAWKVGLDQSGANEEVNSLSNGCLYLSLLPALVFVRGREGFTCADVKASN